jgi:hypothetical protein
MIVSAKGCKPGCILPNDWEHGFHRVPIDCLVEDLGGVARHLAGVTRNQVTIVIIAAITTS